MTRTFPLIARLVHRQHVPWRGDCVSLRRPMSLSMARGFIPSSIIITPVGLIHIDDLLGLC